MTNPDDEIRRHPRTIEQDFEGLFRTMRSKRFRNGEDTGGEPANYIYAYPPEQELEVERRIPMLVNRLQSMDPVDSNDSAPGVLVIDLYKTVIHIMQSDDILESVIGQEAEMHGAKMPIIPMAIQTNGRTCRRTTSIRRSQACSMRMRAS